MSMKNLKSARSFISDVVRDTPKSGIRDFFDIVASMPSAISLGVGEPGLQTPWHIRDAALYALEKGATGYTSNLGLLEFRREISSYLARFLGVTYDPRKEILITTGVSEALDLAVRAIVNAGDEIIYHEPCYVSYRPVIQLSGGVPVPLATEEEEDFELNPDRLEQLITPRTKALILNFPNNPTGATLSRENLERVSEIVRDRDLLLISDEIYAELSYDGVHSSPAALPEMQERTILLHGLSKAWAMTGFRIGYACAPPDLTDAMMTIHQYTMLCAPTLSQFAGVEAFKRVDQDVEEMRGQYRRNRNYMLASFEAMRLPCAKPGGAFYAFPRISGLGVTSEQFALQLLEEETVAVVPGVAFGDVGEGFIRCSFATSLDDIKIAMDRMARFVDRLRSK